MENIAKNHYFVKNEKCYLIHCPYPPLPTNLFKNFVLDVDETCHVPCNFTSGSGTRYTSAIHLDEKEIFALWNVVSFCHHNKYSCICGVVCNPYYIHLKADTSIITSVGSVCIHRFLNLDLVKQMEAIDETVKRLKKHRCVVCKKKFHGTHKPCQKKLAEKYGNIWLNYIRALSAYKRNIARCLEEATEFPWPGHFSNSWHNISRFSNKSQRCTTTNSKAFWSAKPTTGFCKVASPN